MFRRAIIIAFAFVLLGSAATVLFFANRSFVHKPIAAPSLPSLPSLPPAPSSAPIAKSWPTPFSVELRELPTKDVLPPDTLRVLVVGDSVAKFLGLAMRYRQDEKQAFVAERGVGSCSIFESKPYIEDGKQLMSSSCSSKWATDVAELRPDVTLIVMGGAFFNPDTCKKTFQVDYEKRVLELVQSMGPMAGQVVVARVPYPVKDWRHSNVLERVDCFNKMLARIAEKGTFDMLDLMQHVCPTRACVMESEGKPIRPDGLHFDGGGTEETARWILGELARIHKRVPHD